MGKVPPSTPGEYRIGADELGRPYLSEAGTRVQIVAVHTGLGWREIEICILDELGNVVEFQVT